MVSYVCMYVCIYIYMYACMYVSMYIMYTYIERETHTHTNKNIFDRVWEVSYNATHLHLSKRTFREIFVKGMREGCLRVISIEGVIFCVGYVDGSMYERLCLYAICLNRSVVDALPLFVFWLSDSLLRMDENVLHFIAWKACCLTF